MSLILEALKRAEAQRQPGEGATTGDSGLTGADVRPRRRRIWLWPGFALVISGAILVMVLPARRVPPVPGPRAEESPEPAVARLPVPAAPAVREPAVKLLVPEHTEPPVSRPSASVPAAAAPRPAVSPPGPPPSVAAIGPSLAPSAPLQATPPPPARPVPSPPPVPPAETQVISPPREEPSPTELVRRLRESFDKVEVSAHVYAEERTQRFLFVNGRVYREGERVNPEGFRIDEITPDGVVVEREGVRLRVPVAR